MSTTLELPERVKRSREKGWRAPEGAVYVGRGTKWGNPFRYRSNDTGLCRYPAAIEEGVDWEYEGRISGHGTSHYYFHPDDRVTPCQVRFMTRAEIVELYTRCLRGDVPPSVVMAYGRRSPVKVTVDEIRAELAGKQLMCWCPLNAPCHADVLTRVANGADL